MSLTWNRFACEGCSCRAEFVRRVINLLVDACRHTKSRLSRERKLGHASPRSKQLLFSNYLGPRPQCTWVASNEWMNEWMQMAGQPWGGPVVLRAFSTGVQGLAFVVEALPVNSTLHECSTSTCRGSTGWWHRKRAAEQGLMEQNGGWG